MATATGWTFRHIMWKINYQTLIMAVSDQIRYKTKEEANSPSRGSREESGEDNSALAFFQSQAES